MGFYDIFVEKNLITSLDVFIEDFDAFHTNVEKILHLTMRKHKRIPLIFLMYSPDGILEILSVPTRGVPITGMSLISMVQALAEEKAPIAISMVFRSGDNIFINSISPLGGIRSLRYEVKGSEYNVADVGSVKEFGNKFRFNFEDHLVLDKDNLIIFNENGI